MQLHIDGAKVSTHELGAFTTFETRVLYDTYDVTGALAQVGVGAHVLGVEVGPGFYSQKTVKVGNPELLLRLALEFADGTSQDIVSDASGAWQTADGPVTATDIYIGETFNATLEQPEWASPSFSPSAATGWAAAAAASPPSANVTVSSHAVLPRIGIRRSFAAIDMWESSPGEYVFDFGQNMAGFTTLRIPEGALTQPGLAISQLHAEAIHGPPPAPIFHHYNSPCNETAVYISRGDGRAVEYTPLFTYMGFRYVRLKGYPGVPGPDTLTAHFINTLYDEVGSISFSDPDLNAVQRITLAAAQSNFQSIPTDCPQVRKMSNAHLACCRLTLR